MAVSMALLVFLGTFLLLLQSFAGWRRDLAPALRARPVVGSAQVAVIDLLDAPAPTPAPTPAPDAQPTPGPPEVLAVGNTGGDGVYLRRTPRLSDRLRAWPDRTPMVTVGEDVEAEGRMWKHVRDPAGNVGWVPAQYLVAPQRPPTAPAD